MADIIDSGMGLIPVGQVEQALRDLWRSEGLVGAARACTRNLVAVLPSVDNLEDTIHSLTRVAAHHPSRMVILVPDPNTPDPGMAAEVRLACATPPPSSFCCELIALHAREEVWPHTHSTVLALLLPELPVNLWWQRPLEPEDHLFRRLQSLADALLVDSAGARVPDALLTSLHQVGSRFPWGGMDLVWTRLTPWRELIAQLFDPLDRRPYVHAIQRVSFSIAPGSAGTAAALYTIGWLAGQLGWTPQSRWRRDARTRELRFRRREGEVRVSVTQVQSESISPLVRVRIHAGGVVPATFAVSLHDEPGYAEVAVDVGNTHVRQVRPVRWPAREDALSEALQLSGRDRVFERALAGAVRLLKGPAATREKG